MSSGAAPHFKRNVALGLATGALVNVGVAFLDPVTVLPLFIAKLGGSGTLVGFVSAMHGVGWYLPQVLASRVAETRVHVLGMYRLVTAARATALAALVATVFLVDVEHGSLLLSLFVAALLATHLAGGFSAVPFLEIVGKTIPLERRGRFFGGRRLAGGILGIGAGILVSLILAVDAEDTWTPPVVRSVLEAGARKLGLLGHAFPIDFAMLFVLGSLCITAGMLVFCFAGEDPGPAAARPSRLASHVRDGFVLFRSDPDYRRFFVVRLFWQLSAMGFPFYTSYAYHELALSEDVVGLFLSVWVGSGVLSNYVWGRLLDERGNRIVLVAAALLGALAPLVVLGIDAFGPGAAAAVWLLAGTFFVNGAVRSAQVITNLTYLLEYAPRERRPLYVGFLNTLSAPLMLTPIVGGYLYESAGPRVLFAACLAFALANVPLSARLREPRRGAAGLSDMGGYRPS